MTRSIVEAIAAARDRKQLPAFNPGNIGNLATKLGLAVPVSISEIMRALNELPPAVVTINLSEVSTPGGVSGYGQIGLQSDGGASFRGTVVNPGGGGINYMYAVTLLDVRDESGKLLVFANSGNLFNAFTGSSTSFQQDAFSDLIADNWDAAKTTGYYAYIWDDDNVWEDIATALVEALAVVATAGIILVIPGSGGSGEDPYCSWGAGSNSSLTGCYRTK
jgi:hypothetical protein